MAAVTVTVVAEMAHLAEIAVAGMVEAASMTGKHRGVPVNAEVNVNVQVVPSSIEHEPAYDCGIV